MHKQEARPCAEEPRKKKRRVRKGPRWRKEKEMDQEARGVAGKKLSSAGVAFEVK